MGRLNTFRIDYGGLPNKPTLARVQKFCADKLGLKRGEVIRIQNSRALGVTFVTVANINLALKVCEEHGEGHEGMGSDKKKYPVTITMEDGSVTVRLYDLSDDVSNADITNFLEDYGEVWDVYEERLGEDQEFPGIFTGVRIAKMVVNENIGSWVTIKGELTQLSYFGQRQTCRHCRDYLHVGVGCVQNKKLLVQKTFADAVKQPVNQNNPKGKPSKQQAVKPTGKAQLIPPKQPLQSKPNDPTQTPAPKAVNPAGNTAETVIDLEKDDGSVFLMPQNPGLQSSGSGSLTNTTNQQPPAGGGAARKTASGKPDGNDSDTSTSSKRSLRGRPSKKQKTNENERKRRKKNYNATININNITNATKIDALCSFIRAMELDIVFLQEVENERLTIPGFNVICNVDQARRGTAIALKQHIIYTHVEKSLDGRLIALRVQNTTLCNVYAPSGSAFRAERESFFSSTPAYYLRENTDHVILAGDFNCVLRPCDSTGPNASAALQAAVRQLQLHDVWLKLFPNTHAPTYVSHNAESRLDRVYVSAGLCQQLRTAATHVCSFTDHKALTVRICLPHLGHEHGRGFWSLRPHLLTQETKEEFAVRWQYWTRQRNRFPNALEWWITFAKPKIKTFFLGKSRDGFRAFQAEHQRLYAELRQAYDAYYQDATVITTIHRVKARMLTLQREFSQNFARVNDTFIAGESLSTFQLGERRRKKTTITRLINERDEALQTQPEIEQHVLQYFTELYAADPPGVPRDEEALNCNRVIPEGDAENSALVAEITVGEIKSAIKASPKRKSPGADGLTAEFMAWAYDIIYRELHAVMNELLVAPIPAAFSEGTIVLVKKSGRSGEQISSYRPISLCNTDSRIFSRILRQRLTAVLHTHNVLTVSQKCGEHRSIFQATLALKDKISSLLARKVKGKLISFDLDHAFDRVSLPFLYRTMVSLGLNPNFVSLLERHFAQAGSRIIVNGHTSARFPIKRSVRQGDPLSMVLFCLYMHPLLVELERICVGELCVAYADDVTVVVTSTQTIEAINGLFSRFEFDAGGKLNRQKTVAIDVGHVEGDPLVVPWLQTVEKVKVLGVVFTNSVRLMIKLNWDAQVTKVAQLIALHSMRTLTLQQKVILLNTFITSKVWYLASTLPPYQVHVAKLTATIGSYLFRGLPARIPLQQLARPKEDGGLKLQLPALKCKALCINRHLQEIDHLPFYKSFLDNATPPPTSLPCLKLLCQQTPLLPASIRDSPSSDQIHRHFLEDTAKPRVETKEPNLNWRQIWKNISSRRLTSGQRSELYMLVNEKTEHRKLMYVIQRADGPNCQHCVASEETIKHKFCECSRVQAAWAHTQQKIATIAGRRRISFDQLFRPVLNGIANERKVRILKSFIAYIGFVNNRLTPTFDVAALDFELDISLL